MRNYHSLGPRGAVAIVPLMALACGLSVNFTSTAVPTQPPFQLPTGIAALPASPTSAPAPTVENAPPPAPAITPTVQSSDVAGEAQDYFGRGYLPYEGGE